jgi:hypothetical protein
VTNRNNDPVKLEVLIDEIKKLNRINNSPWNRIKNGFLAGVATTVGATFGFALIVILLGFISQALGSVPVISNLYEGSELQEIIDYQVQQIEERREQDTEEGDSEDASGNLEDEGTEDNNENQRNENDVNPTGEENTN